MINIKIEKRYNGTVSSVLAQGHSNANVGAAVSALMQACGSQLEAMKSGIMQITDAEMFLIDSIKQSKPATAVAETLANGLEALERQYPFSVVVKHTRCKD